MDISVIILSRGGKISDKLKKSLGFAGEVLILKNPNITNFAKVRNDGLAKAKGNWVLFVDDDEEVGKPLANEIVKAARNKSIQGYFIKRDNYFLGKFQGTDRVLRLSRRDAGGWRRRVHETWNVKGKTGVLKNRLIHKNTNTLYKEIEKINMHSSLHAKANQELGKKSNLVKIVFFPFAKFLQVMLDGRGFMIALMHSLHSFLAWSKLYIWQRNSR